MHHLQPHTTHTPLTWPCPAALHHRHDWLAGHAFYYDINHPDGDSGHRALSELLYQLLQDTLAELQELPVVEQERSRALVGRDWRSCSMQLQAGQLGTRSCKLCLLRQRK